MSSSVASLSAAACVALAALACEGDAAPTRVRFVDVDSADLDGSLAVRSASFADARAELLDELDDRQGAVPIVGEGAWRTRVMLRGGADAEQALQEGRSYAVHGEGDLRLDVRVAAGDRGAFAGGEVQTGAERAMVQVKLDDPAVIGARFRIAVFADDGPGAAHPRDVTPRHLARPVPKGRYRAWLDVPPSGVRFVVHVTVLDDGERAVGQAWSSPVAVVRPWL